MVGGCREPECLPHSFKCFHEYEHLEEYDFDNAYSIAVYQPNWYRPLQVTSVFDIRNEAGEWTRPRDFIPEGHDPTQPSDELLRSYRNALMGLYLDRRDAISRLLSSTSDDLTLCCWCPYDKAAKRQLHDYGSFVCHSAVVELYLELSGITVHRDPDRERMVRL